MNDLSPEELLEFREIFNLVDKDRSGRISRVALSELIDTLGIDATPEDIEEMINEVDADGDGSITFEEFVAVMSRKVQATYSKGQVKVAFHVFENKSCPAGYLRADDLIMALQTYGTEKLTKQQAIDLVKQLDIDQNGLINYDDYVNMMMSS